MSDQIIKSPAVLDEVCDEPGMTSLVNPMFFNHNEAVSAAVEAERRRLAAQLDGGVMEALNLLIHKGEIYGELVTHNDDAYMTVSVLNNLARAAMQQLRDLQANLNPTTLEVLGLEPALEALAAQVSRSSRLQIHLFVERQRERLTPQIELALFRTAQEVLEYSTCFEYPSQATMRLETIDHQVIFTFTNPHISASEQALRGVAWRAEVIGGHVDIRLGLHNEGFELQVSFPLEAPVQITAREREVLHWLGEGLANKEIADRMSVSPRTVNFHLDNIYSKLGVNSRTEAVLYAVRHHLIRRSPAAS
jgi:DNA-binding CsgD family transcriptional regulator